MKLRRRLFKYSLYTAISGALFGLLAIIGSYIYIAPSLPSVSTLQDFRLQVPLRVYSEDLKLIAEFGSKKRTPVTFDQTPELLINAFLAAEDNRFYQHPGVDYQGILRAVVNLARTGERSQGGSTITMQVARNFFLSREKTYLRKINEIYLSLKIERELSKQDILELYINKIYLGNRAYGVQAAAMIYYGVPVQELTLAQMATIAGLPKAPSRYNPIAGPERAFTRRNYILNRMLTLGYINQTMHDEAVASPATASLHRLKTELSAPYIAEMVRSTMVGLYGDKAYTNGYRVITTINSKLQNAANHALRNTLYAYDLRHGYRGIIKHHQLESFFDNENWDKTLKKLPRYGDMKPAIVVSVENQTAYVMPDKYTVTKLNWDGLSWARQYITDNKLGPKLTLAKQVVTAGDIIYIRQNQQDLWLLAQLPEAEGALVSLNPDNGAIVALNGGFDFFRSKFNRATQAERQPGSSFKPFIYSSALEKGFTTASIINDAPVVFEDASLEDSWRPENYSGRFFGPTRLRVALFKSRNLVSIRLLRSVGLKHAIKHLEHFGFDPDHMPHNLSLALGSASVTPLELATGYTVFANGGYAVKPHFIKYVEDMRGEVVFKTHPDTVCRECPEAEIVNATVDNNELTPTGQDLANETEDTLQHLLSDDIHVAKRVIPEDNVYLMTTLMRDVVKRGTARRARVLKRNDLAGKTGTTNDQRDAWFSGFNPDYVTVTWVGFDKIRSLGNYETGGRAALPMWIDYMKVALANKPQRNLIRPPGIVTVRIDPETGLLAGSNTKNSIFETFRKRYAPTRYAESNSNNNTTDAVIPEQVF